MMDKKLILSTGGTFLVTALVILGVINLTSPKLYFCEERQTLMECDKISAYYGLPNGKCWNNEVGNKLCKSGWTQDFKIVDEENMTEPIIDKEVLCPECHCPDCPQCSVCEPCPPPTECINKTIFVGGGGGGSDCPECECPQCDCPQCEECEACNTAQSIQVIAYTETGKYFCNGIGADVECVKADDLSMPFG